VPHDPEVRKAVAQLGGHRKHGTDDAVARLNLATALFKQAVRKARDAGVDVVAVCCGR
jgi:hypothetical protein